MLCKVVMHSEQERIRNLHPQVYNILIQKLKRGIIAALVNNIRIVLSVSKKILAQLAYRFKLTVKVV